MRILYVSSRINAPDGSSVHGRAFVRSTKKLEHTIETYPPILPIDYIQDKSNSIRRTFAEKARNFNAWKLLKSRMRRLGRHTGDLVDFMDGIVETIRYFFAIRKLLKTFSPDVLVYRATLFNFAPHLIRKLYRIPCVAEVNSIKYLEISIASRSGAAARLTKFAEQFAINHSDRVFVVSESIKLFVDQFYTPEHSFIVPNGVETEVFDPRRFNKKALKKELGLGGRRVLGYVGSYKAWHGLDISLDLIKQLRRSPSEFVLLLIGNGEQYALIKSRIKEEGLEDCVLQVDYVPHSDVPKYAAVFDYAVMTYPDFEGFYFSPLKMYEYMSMGVPIVSTDTGQISSIIEHQENGVLVNPPTADNFQMAIEAIESSTHQYKKISEISRKEAIDQYSWLENARQVMFICSELLGQNPNITETVEV